MGSPSGSSGSLDRAEPYPPWARAERCSAMSRNRCTVPNWICLKREYAPGFDIIHRSGSLLNVVELQGFFPAEGSD